MNWLEIILGFVAGGGLLTLLTLGLRRKQVKNEVKADEIDTMRKAMESFYTPLLETQDKRIAAQNERIAELETEVRTLRKEKQEQEDAYRKQIVDQQKQITELQKQITDITRALGIKANKQLRASNGQFARQPDGIDQ